MGGRVASAPRLLSAALALSLLPIGATAAAVAGGPADPEAPALQILPLLWSAPAPGPAEDDRHLVLPPTSTRAFSTLGVTWSPTGQVEVDRVEVRTRSARTGRWSGWRTLPVEPRQSTATGGRDGTTAMYVGGSDAVEARVTARGAADPVDLRVDLIDPAATPSGSSLTPVAVAGLGGALVIPARTGEPTLGPGASRRRRPLPRWSSQPGPWRPRTTRGRRPRPSCGVCRPSRR
jgi:hypothetical protein